MLSADDSWWRSRSRRSSIAAAHPTNGGTRPAIFIAGGHVKEFALPGCGRDAQLVGLPVNRHQFGGDGDSKTERGTLLADQHGTERPKPAPCVTGTARRPPARPRHRGPPATAAGAVSTANTPCAHASGAPRDTRPHAGRSAGNQPDGTQQHGLARSGLAGDRRHTTCRREQGATNRTEVMNFKLFQHGPLPAFRKGPRRVRRNHCPRALRDRPLRACSRQPTTGRSNLVTRRFVNGTPDRRANRKVLFDSRTSTRVPFGRARWRRPSQQNPAVG